jgi:Fe-S cluster assembly scaffold protein SufB
VTDTPTGASVSPPGIATASQSAGPRKPRATRRAPADLPFTFADRSLAEALSAERAEPAWLRDVRLEASKAFDAMVVESNQLYTPYIDLRAASLETVRPYVQTESASSLDEERASTDVPAGVAGVIELSEDRVVALALTARARAAGVVLETFGAALRRDPDAFRAILTGASTLPPDDKLAVLAQGFWSQGVRLHVPDGVVLDGPILVRWRAGNPGRALITRTLVTLGEGAIAQLVEEQQPSGPRIECAAGETVPQAFFHGTTEVILGRGATLAMASIQDLPADQITFQHRHASIGDGATLNWALAQLGSRLVRSRVDNRLVGEHASVEQVEIVFGAAEQFFDLTSYTRHIGRDTTGNLLSKGVLLDRSRSYLKGLISIEKTAVGTDSYLGEFGMNLSKAARAVAIPSLEIDQPDCRRAAHSSAVGPIDPTQLFYLESRGIPPDEARKFIVLGFLEPVVARVPLESAREDLRALLDAKWDEGWSQSDPAAADGAAA